MKLVRALSEIVSGYSQLCRRHRNGLAVWCWESRRYISHVDIARLTTKPRVTGTIVGVVEGHQKILND